MLKNISLRILALITLVSLVVFGSYAVAQNNSFHQEQRIEAQTIAALSEWVSDSTKNIVSPKEAATIVRQVYRYAKTHNVDPLLILAMTRQESGFRTTAKSKAGAKGLMQVIPYWHKDKIKGRNIFDTAVNIDVGTQVIDQCLDKAKDNVRVALRCYSGGASPKYYNRIAASHKQLRTYLVEYAMLNEQPVGETLAFGKPRIFTPDVINEHLMAAKKAVKDPADT